MLRIVALNEEGSEEELQDEMPITKEAQETIAEAEYMKAVQLKSQGKCDTALSLLRQLLETKVLNEISWDNKSDKLWLIRYNCHKNIAMICEEQNDHETTLQNYVLAMQIDDTDVYTMHRFGQFALTTCSTGLAEIAFEKCLKQNPVHGSAARGILQIFLKTHNIMGAYSWALKLYKHDPYFKDGLKVIRHIRSKFKHLIPFYEQIWKSLPLKFESDDILSENECNIFAKKIEREDENLKLQSALVLHQFCENELNWISIAHYITSVYEYLDKSQQNKFFILYLENIVSKSNDNSNNKDDLSEVNTDICCEESCNNSNSTSYEDAKRYQNPICDPETYSQGLSTAHFEPSNKNSSLWQNSDINNEDSDSNTKSDGNEVIKPKPRRRCSDLHFLEQWGWHKNRRYTSRKKAQPDRTEVDTSLNGFLRKILSKFVTSSFEDKWPFIRAQDCVDGNDFNDGCEECSRHNQNPSNKSFQNETRKEFDDFITELKAKRFDLMLLIYKWLKSISALWNKNLPADIKMLYINIFNLYIKHFEFSTWNQLSSKSFECCYRICLLFLEIEYDNVIKQNRELPSDWKVICNNLTFMSGYAFVTLSNNFEIYKLRLINMEYLYCNFCNELQKCVLHLENMRQILANEPNTFTLHLPNMSGVCINTNYICSTVIKMQRQLALMTVPKLFEQENWKELFNIISNNISHSRDMHHCENWLSDFKVQFEILLQSLWSTNEYESCLLWSEKFLHFFTYHYLKETKNSNSQRHWEELISFDLTYIEAISLNEGFDIFDSLDNNMLSRMVQNITRIVSYQLDGTFDKNLIASSVQDTKRAWVILHQVILREENNSTVVFKSKSSDSEEEDDLLPNSFLLLFTAHEFLGKHQLCTKDNGDFLHHVLDTVSPNLRAPLYDGCRDIIYEYVEQVTYCLYGYPQKKARSRHLEDHEANNIELTWARAIQLFDLYRPENLPEFNSYKLESITADMEQLLLKFVLLMPQELYPKPATTKITEFINGQSENKPNESECFKLPYKISSIFYLLADYYFKTRDFQKTIEYYTLDLACNPMRFDSWAGMALSKASKIETKINSLTAIDLSVILKECEDAIRCFDQCINLNRNQILLWIEYGSFAYTIHSFCSRYLKHSSENLSIDRFSFVEDKKEKMLNIAFNCFSIAASLQNTSNETNDETDEKENEEKWLCQYMLGKISEKRKEKPQIYLNNYLKAANFLYENNATYPIKINHSNPTTLSIEALEVFYRTNAAIIKYLEHEKNISREIGDLFNNVLKNLANSPFAFNKAKLDGNSLNALKRKVVDKIEQDPCNKMTKEHISDSIALSKKPTLPPQEFNEASLKYNVSNEEQSKASDASSLTGNINNSELAAKDCKEVSNISSSRRESQESGVTGTTTTITSSATSTTSSSDSSASESDSDSETTSTENELKKRDKNAQYTTAELEHMYKIVVRNLEECITRFPEHYKSFYRLVYHYMNGPANLYSLTHCEELLFKQYKTSLGNQINGLFFDRKNNNIFNGIWRIPSSEFDRPGSFSAHLVKCVGILIQLLMKINNPKLLIDIGLQLYKIPDQDKRYITDTERMELYQQSITFCSQILRNTLTKNMKRRDDEEVLNLLIDIYKIHKKCIKYLSQKEAIFTQLLVDVYKFYIQNKINFLPDNLNYLDLSIKLCLQEINFRKNSERLKSSNLNEQVQGVNSINPSSSQTTAVATMSIPGLTMRKSRATSQKVPSNSNYGAGSDRFAMQPVTSTFSEASNLMSVMAIYQNSHAFQKDPIEFRKLVVEHYKKALESGQKGLPSNTINLQTGLQTFNFDAALTSSNLSQPIVQNKQLTQSINLDASGSCIMSNFFNKDFHNPSSEQTNFVDAGLQTSAASVTPSYMDISKQSFQKTDITNSGVILVDHQSSQPVDACSTSNKQSLKTKYSSKNKCGSSKPYSRQALPGTILLQSLNNYGTPPNLFPPYPDLQQFNLLPQELHYDGKPILKTPMDAISLSANTTTTAATAVNSTQGHFISPMFDANAISMNSLSNVSITASLASITAKTIPLSNTSIYPPQVSPTKTLQQKLAERQKANKINESKNPSNTKIITAERKTSVDVIILD